MVVVGLAGVHVSIPGPLDAEVEASLNFLTGYLEGTPGRAGVVSANFWADFRRWFGRMFSNSTRFP
jgi:hypothetical protein